MFVSVTRLHLRSARFVPGFLYYTLRSLRQIRRSAGHVAREVHRDRHGAYWTLSVWRDEAAMRAFMLTGAHRRAMPKLLHWCDEAAVVHWEQAGNTLPTRRHAHQQMIALGRPSKVNHPSARQRAFEIPPP